MKLGTSNNTKIVATMGPASWGSYPVRLRWDNQPRVIGGDLTGKPLMTAPDCLRGRDWPAALVGRSSR